MNTLKTIFFSLFLLLAFVACASFPQFAGRNGSSDPCVFAFNDDQARRVDLVGSFNGWKIGATPLAADGTGSWTTRVQLPKGVYQYMFVIDGRRWVPDPEAPQKVPDGFGRMNSLRIVE